MILRGKHYVIQQKRVFLWKTARYKKTACIFDTEREANKHLVRLRRWHPLRRYRVVVAYGNHKTRILY